MYLQLFALVQQARNGDAAVAAQLTAFLQQLANNSAVPSEVQSLANVLLQLLAGNHSPHLTRLSAELAAAVWRVFAT